MNQFLLFNVGKAFKNTCLGEPCSEEMNAFKVIFNANCILAKVKIQTCNQNTTISGRKCQKWSLNYPHRIPNHIKYHLFDLNNNHCATG